MARRWTFPGCVRRATQRLEWSSRPLQCSSCSRRTPSHTLCLVSGLMLWCGGGWYLLIGSYHLSKYTVAQWHCPIRQACSLVWSIFSSRDFCTRTGSQASQLTLKQPFCKTTKFTSSFVPSMISVWNTLDSEIVSCLNIVSFKLLLCQYFSFLFDLHSGSMVSHLTLASCYLCVYIALSY